MDWNKVILSVFLINSAWAQIPDQLKALEVHNKERASLGVPVLI